MNAATTDPDLIERIKDWREDEGWRQFYARYAPSIEAHARRSGLSAEESQDVVQTTMLKVATYIPRFEYDQTVCKFRTWLNQIVNQRIIAIWQDRRKSRLPEQVQTELTLLLSGDEASPADAAAHSELQHQMLQVCLARVKASANPKHWQIFETNVLAQVPTSEVASRFETTAANVWVIRHRFVRRLKKEWAALLDEPFPASPRSAGR